MTEPIEIPAACRAIKDIFPTRPGMDVVAEVWSHIRETGTPHTWRGHTHTKPPKNATAVYLEEFDLPAATLRAKHFAPCPCCSPDHPKFGRDGKIAWFPNEAVIRLIGPDCFATYGPDNHKAAISQLQMEREKRRNEAFLLQNIPRLADVLNSLRQALPIAEATFAFHAQLHDRLGLFRVGLWRHVRDGSLSIAEQSIHVDTRPDGSVVRMPIDSERIYASLAGYQLLNPDLRDRTFALRNAMKVVSPFVGADLPLLLKTLDDRGQRASARALSRSIHAASLFLDELRQLTPFVHRSTVNTLRRWGEHKGCPQPLYYQHRGDRIAIGRSEFSCATVDIPRAMLDRVPTLAFRTFENGDPAALPLSA